VGEDLPFSWINNVQVDEELSFSWINNTQVGEAIPFSFEDLHFSRINNT
jgi:hypothetical protein